MECAYCREPLAIGADAFGACQGVLGRERFIPFEDTIIVCSPRCLCRFFDTDSPRIPLRDP